MNHIDDMPRVVSVHDSNAILQLGYDPTHRILRIHFRQTDTTWEYAQVWPSEFAQLVAAYSVGAAFNERIRNTKPAQRIDPPSRTHQAGRSS